LGETSLHVWLEKESVILLNITGGGRVRLAMDHQMRPATPQLRLTREELSEERTVDRVAALAETRDSPEAVGLITAYQSNGRNA
jgi:hypothetical protein